MLIQDSSDVGDLSRVVVLGATSFIGSHLVARLTRDNVKTLGFTSKSLDLTQPGAVARLIDLLRPTDTVVLLASVPHRKRTDTDAFIKNLAIADTVCRAVARVACAHVVYLSSDSVYPFGEAPITEMTAAAPPYLYSAMHATREIMFRQEVTSRLAILRLTQIYGPGDTHNAYGPHRMLNSALMNGRIDLFGGGEETRDHLYIDDLINLMVEVLHRRATGLLNVASGISTSFADVAQIVAAQFAHRIEIASVPRQLPRITHRQFDISALRALVPSFKPVALAEGIKLTLAAQQEAPAKPKAAAS